jgi:uncharacterized protein (TIGR01777 family)
MQNVKNILITGGSGLIGTRLTELLMTRGYQVSHLGRTKKDQGVKTFLWDIDQQAIDPEAFESMDTIIHLAGAGVSDKRWTDKRKQEILESRTRSTRLLKDKLNTEMHSIKNFISASGINYYGFGEDEKAFVESDKPGNDFLSKVTQAWENEADQIAKPGLRVVKIRIGFVLSNRGGALKKLAKPIKMMAGAPLGSGKQYISWIHIDDLCNLFIKAIEDTSMHGAYNGVGPYPVTNKTLTEAIAGTLKKPLLLPPIPGFILKIILGEMAEIVLKGSRISSQKIQDAGFSFQYKTLEDALRNTLSPQQQN